MKKLFALSIVFAWSVISLYGAAFGSSCEPNCDEFATEKNLWAHQRQNQNAESYGEPGDFNSQGEQNQFQRASGVSSENFEGEAVMDQAQYMTYDTARRSVNHYGNMYQEMSSQGKTGPDCDLNIHAGQNQSGETQTSYSDTMMSAGQVANADARANLYGAPETTGVNLFQEQSHGYYQERPEDGSWQGGMIHTKTRLTAGNPPSVEVEIE